MQALRSRCSGFSGVNAHTAEIVAKARLHKGTRSRIKRLAAGMQSVMNAGRRRLRNTAIAAADAFGLYRGSLMRTALTTGAGSATGARTLARDLGRNPISFLLVF